MHKAKYLTLQRPHPKLRPFSPSSITIGIGVGQLPGSIPFDFGHRLVETTQYSLLNRLQHEQSGANRDADAWGRFVQIYAPLLEEWARRLRVPEQDRQDLIQETLVKLLSKIGAFRRSESGTFRGWLHTMLRNTWLDRLRRTQPQAAFDSSVVDPEASDPQLRVERDEYRQYVLRRVFGLLLSDFPPTTQAAFRKYVIEGQAASDVADELGISTNALYLIRSRILKRLQAELAELLDD